MSQQAQAVVQTQQKIAEPWSIKGSMLQHAAVAPAITPVYHGILQRCSGGVECEECRQRRLGMLQRAAVNAAPVNSVPPIVHDVLSSSGQPLDAGTRAFMEPRFGHDFSQVRVHTDAKAAESARAVNALAYTVGRDVVFGEGEYEPGTSEGRRLLTHELTHVVQQRSDALQSKLTIGEPGDGYEQEADRISDSVMNEGIALAQPDAITSPISPSIQRTMICSKRLEAPGIGLFANHSYIDDTGRNDCLGSGLVGNYAITDLISGNFIRGCATKTDRSPDPRGKTPHSKPCNPKSGVANLSSCLRNAYNSYADPSIYSNEAVAAGAAGGAVVGGVAGSILGGVVGGIVGGIAGAYGGARLLSGANGPNSNTFAATLAAACCEDASDSGLGWVPGWHHAPALPCSPRAGMLVASSSGPTSDKEAG